MKVIKYILFLGLTCLLFEAKAGVEPTVTSYLPGKYFINYTPNPDFVTTGAVFTNGLSGYALIGGQYGFQATQQVRKIDNLLHLYIDPDASAYIDFAYTLEVKVEIIAQVKGTNAPTNLGTEILVVGYNPTERTVYNEKATLHFANAGYVSYRVLSATFSPTLSDAQKAKASMTINMGSEIIIERYKAFDETVIPLPGSINHFHNTLTNELSIWWYVSPGAEMYELEWAYVDNYGDLGVERMDIDLKFNKDYNLSTNSTRVQLSTNSYQLPLVYERGYIIFRVRHIGKKYVSSPEKVYTIPGQWSDASFGNLPNLNSFAHKYKITSAQAHEDDKMNWQVITSYAEDGKRKDVVSYMDGTQRSRQTITGLSNELTTLVGEAIYDHQGRAAIQVLPAPVSNFYAAANRKLMYYNNFNRNNAGNPYQRSEFDLTVNPCAAFTAPMNTASGASNYYSGSNPDKTNENAYIPDAKNYPFSQTEFTPDNTGRIRKQGGVGLNHQLGSTHETDYYYGAPMQEELHMLFGNEAGDASHYKKNMVKDANGQLNVSILNLSGNVVATALAGNPPANLDQLNNYQPYLMNVDLLAFNKKDEENRELISHQSIVVSTQSDYELHYTVSNTAYQAALCNGIQLCLSCVYDLQLKIIDNYSCNHEMYDTAIVVKPFTFTNGAMNVNDACPASTLAFNSANFPSPFKVNLPVGSYTIIKSLKVNDAAANAYVDHYLNRFKVECNSIYDDILAEQLALVDSAACNITDSGATENRCDIARMAMLSDLNPGGQYGLIDWSNNTATEPTSVFNLTNSLPQPQANWKHPIGHYKDENGVIVQITDPITNAYIFPEQLNTLSEFLAIWKESFAESLLPYHPEYCYLDWCGRVNSSSFEYDVRITLTPKYNDAIANGFFTPMTADPYFATTAVHYANGINTIMSGQLANFKTTGFSLLQMAVITTFNANNYPYTTATINSWISNPSTYPTITDQVWETYRAFYLSKKEELQYADRVEYAMNICSKPPVSGGFSNRGGYNECIGVGGASNAFNWQQNGFGTGSGLAGIYNSPFFISGQTCGISTYYLYASKGVRFPGFPGAMAPIDPYAPNAATTIQQANDVVNNSNPCTTCADKIKLQLQGMLNGLFMDTARIRAPRTVSITASNPVAPELLNAFYYAATPRPIATPTYINVTEQNGKLIIRISNSNTTKDTTGCKIVLSSKGRLNWNDIISICCIGPDLSNNQGNLFELKATLRNNTAITIQLSLPNCPLICKDVIKEDCPPTDFTNDISNLLNQLMIRKKFAGRDTLNGLLSGVLKTDFSIGGKVQWDADYNKSKLTGILSVGKKKCEFTLDLPAGVNPENFVIITNIVPDATSIDPVSGYTYSANVTIRVSNPDRMITTKLKNTCYPFSYCKRCAPEAVVAKSVNSIIALPRQNATQQLQASNSVYTSPGTVNRVVPNQTTLNGNPPAVIPQTPVVATATGVDQAKLPRNRICYPCTGISFTYDSAGQTIRRAPAAGSCDPCHPRIDSAITDSVVNDCIAQQVQAAYVNAQNAYQQILDSIKISMKSLYIEHCLLATETFTAGYKEAMHHFTLYYYNQAGNLVKTVPPNGVTLLTVSQVALAKTNMLNNYNSMFYAPHSMLSQFWYNSLDQLREQSQPDHDGKGIFFYDYLGRMVASQNAQQQSQNKYSYTLYDAVGRIYEVGELNSVPFTLSYAQGRNPVQFAGWVNGSTKTQITKTRYDIPFTSIVTNYFGGDASNFRGRVASSMYFETNTATYINASHYRYDVHGNVKVLVQDLVKLPAKLMEYEYDLLSGKVNRLNYQPGKTDQFIHRYLYDADNRLTQVHTSSDGFVWDNDAIYKYNKHGPLARTVLGQNKVQGQDYVYTIQGWIKGVNSPTLNYKYDPGNDGAQGGAHPTVARDATGYMLRYFTGDYKTIATGIIWEPTYIATPFHRQNKDLYNGNIQSMITAIGSPKNSHVPMGVMTTGYTYDQLNRITTMQAFTPPDITTNSFAASTGTTNYGCIYSYDANGNLLTLKSNGAAPAQLQMDDLSYNYYTGSNRLNHVYDAVATTNYTTDIDAQSTGNYKYDKVGNLVADNAENLAISWSVYGKIKDITKGSAITKYTYGPTGSRIIKEYVDPTTNQTTFTFYVKDASDNVLATYQTNTNPSNTAVIRLQSFFIYGSARLGEQRIDLSMAQLDSIKNLHSTRWNSNRTRGLRYYELSNHLGNVLATVSDRKLAQDPNNTGQVQFYNADLWTATDYYPFGSMMPGRSFSSGNYQFGFNGKENDNDIKGNGNQQDYGMRIYDPRLGRFLSVDPAIKKHPALTAYHFASNRPVDGIDLNGLEHITYLYRVENGKPMLQSVNVSSVDYNGWHGIKVGIYFPETDKMVYKEIHMAAPPKVEVKMEVPIGYKIDAFIRGNPKNMHQLEGEKGMAESADMLDNLGKGFEATGVGAPVGAALGVMSIGMKSILDFKYKDWKTAALNTATRAGTKLIGVGVDKVLDKVNAVIPKTDYNAFSQEVGKVLFGEELDKVENKILEVIEKPATPKK
ncbi:MAG: hypothetical protein H7296_11005 [Bacteroidia bacterium]|nr:hypothetical protein [Bacteroidia bacterium]